MKQILEWVFIVGLSICFGILFAASLSNKACAADNILRDDDGRIHRNHIELAHFKKANPCPATGKIVTGGCKGFVIDHYVPLCAGGLDDVSNMRWEGEHESKIKDKYELQLCANKITLEAFKKMWR